MVCGEHCEQQSKQFWISYLTAFVNSIFYLHSAEFASFGMRNRKKMKERKYFWTNKHAKNVPYRIYNSNGVWKPKTFEEKNKDTIEQDLMINFWLCILCSTFRTKDERKRNKQKSSSVVVIAHIQAFFFTKLYPLISDSLLMYSYNFCFFFSFSAFFLAVFLSFGCLSKSKFLANLHNFALVLFLSINLWLVPALHE